MIKTWVNVFTKAGSFDFIQFSKCTGAVHIIQRNVSTFPPLQERSNYCPSYYYKMDSTHKSKGSKCPPVPTADKIRIYSMRFCPFAQRAILVALAIGIPHEVVNCNLKEKPEWLLEKNPFGKVPVLEQADGRILYESLIVSEYLDEMYVARRLRAVAPYQKAIDRMWIDRFGKAIVSFYKVLFAIPSENHDIIIKYFPRFAAGMKALDKELAERKTKFFGSDDVPGMLDYMIWPWVERYPAFESVIPVKYLKDFQSLTDNMPNLMRWQSDMMEDFAVKEFVLPIEVHKEFIQSLLSGSPNYDILSVKR